MIWWRRDSRKIQKTFLYEIRVCKKPTKNRFFFFNLVFFFLNVKFPRFLVQMSEWCYWSQCSWFCFLLVIYGRCLTRVLVFLHTRPNRSMTVFVCFALSFIVLAVSCILDCYRILYHFSIIIWVIPNKAVKKKWKEEAYPYFHEPFWGN